MEIVQLGLMQSVFDWVYQEILNPVWEFVSSLISAGFDYLGEVIPAIINAVMGTIIGEVISLILDWYYMKWFMFQSAILLLLDCIEDCFNVVSGLRPVYVRAGGGSGAVTGQGMPFLYAVFKQEVVRNAFLAMIVVGFTLCFGMAILATARNFLELGGDRTKPVTHIIRMTAKSLLYLVLAPFTAVALIMLSQTILTTIDKALTSGNEGRTSIARIVFCISSLDAVDTFIHDDGDEYNVSYTKGPSKASVTDKYRKEFYYEDDHFLIPNYTNPVLVRKTFTIHGFDYWISFGCGIFFTVVMCMVLSVFIGRIMDVMVLLIIEPFFVAMMPFDDGEYYKKWFELFIGKLFQGFGSVIAMRVYLMILEQLFSGNISFSNSKNLGARLQDYLMMLLFAMGGAVAVRHIGPLVTGILSQAAASGEQAYAAAGWTAGSAIANKETGMLKKAALKDAKKVGKMLGGATGELIKRFAGGKQGHGGGAGGGVPGEGAGDGIGQFSNNSRPAIPPAGGMGGSLAGKGGSSAAQKSLASFSASVMGGAAGGKGGTGKVPGGAGMGAMGGMSPGPGGAGMGGMGKGPVSAGMGGMGKGPVSAGMGGMGRGPGVAGIGGMSGMGKGPVSAGMGGMSAGGGSTGMGGMNAGGGSTGMGGINAGAGMGAFVNGMPPLNNNPEGADKDKKGMSMDNLVGGAGGIGNMNGGAGGKFDKAPVNSSPSGGTPPVSGNMGTNKSGQNMGGGSGKTGGQAGTGGKKTMQDMVGGNQGGNNPGGGSLGGGSLGGGSLGGGSLGGGSLGGGSLGGGSLGGGSLGGGSTGSSNMGGGSTGSSNMGGGSTGSSNMGGGSSYSYNNSQGGNASMHDMVGNGGSNQSMHDIVGSGGNNQSMHNILNEDKEDPLNTAFYGYNDDNDDGSFL